MQLALLSTLDALLGLSTMSVAADRNSAGISTVAIWMQPVLQPEVTTGEVKREEDSNHSMDDIKSVPAEDSNHFIDDIKNVPSVATGSVVAKEAAGSESVQQIRLIVIDQQNTEVQFLVWKDTPLRKLMDAYCSRFGLQRSRARFTTNGAQIGAKDTAEKLGLKDQGLIGVVMVLDG